MFRRTVSVYFTVHSPRGINFSLSADDSLSRLKDMYGKRWFGATLEYLHLQQPAKEFLPFYFCRGRIHAVFTGTASYTESGEKASRTHYVTTSPQMIDSVFEENRTQVYAGYKYNISHVQHALRDERNPLKLQKMSTVDLDGATINLFEQSTLIMRQFVHEEVHRQVHDLALEKVRAFHPTASSVSVDFSQFSIKVDEVTPVFMPCYVIKATYDNQEYTLYVSGSNGVVSGPYIFNALYVGRAAGLATVALGLLLTPNKVAGFFYGSIAALVVYYVAFYAAKLYPQYQRDTFRRKRERMKTDHIDRNTEGFRPHTTSQRMTEEYSSSSYWDTHAYQQRTQRPNTSGGFTSSGGERRIVRDVHGYYRLLELNGNESVNEIRSAYRKLVLAEHPDVGGSTTQMAKLNEAYRVLRDPARRTAYDQM